MARGKLYRGGAKRGQLRSFNKRYGSRGKYIYGATVGKVHREQIERHERGKEIEHVKEGWVPAHWSRRDGKRFRVRGHKVKRHLARIRL